MPALAAVVRGQVIADVACTVRRPGRLDQDQALGWVVDVHDVHRVYAGDKSPAYPKTLLRGRRRSNGLSWACKREQGKKTCKSKLGLPWLMRGISIKLRFPSKELAR